MTWQTIRAGITIKYPQFTISGDVLYDPEQHALVHHDPTEGDEWLSNDLTASGHVARPGECFVKDWSEHSGFAAALVAAGVVEIVERVAVGPFRSLAYRVLVAEAVKNSPVRAYAAMDSDNAEEKGNPRI